MSMLALLLAAAIQNPAIDMRGYLAMANEAAAYRESRRVSEEGQTGMKAFLKKEKPPWTSES